MQSVENQTDNQIVSLSENDSDNELVLIILGLSQRY